MPTPPFSFTSPADASFTDKLMSRPSEKNALVELNNKLATVDDVKEVTFDTIEELNAKYKTDLHRCFPESLACLHETFIKHTLEDSEFTQDEIDQIWHLQQLFGISYDRHNEIYLRVAEQVYKRNLTEVISDGSISTEERSFLENLSDRLGLSEEVKKHVYESEVSYLVNERVKKLIEDKALSPDEEKELSLLAESFGATLELSDRSVEDLDRCRLRWRIMHGVLPELNVNLQMRAGEICHFYAAAKWHEHRTETRSISYGGLSIRLKICKGLYWNTGRLGVSRDQIEAFKHIDSGDLYLTNKRVIFLGSTKNTSLRLSEILDFELYKDGVEIQKAKGRSPTFCFNNCEFFSMILARLILQDS